MIDTKEYAALQEECERLRAENQRLNKCLARYRAKYGELSEPDKGGEIGALSAVEIKSGKRTNACRRPEIRAAVFVVLVAIYLLAYACVYNIIVKKESERYG